MMAELPAIAALAGWWRLMLLALVSLAAAASEGVGVVLLVPLLAALADGNIAQSLPFALPQWSLGTILLVFVGLVALRSLAEFARNLIGWRVTVAVVDGLRHDAVTALMGAEWRQLSAMHQSRNRALLVTSVDRAGEAVQLLAMLAQGSATLIALLIAAFALSPPFALAGGLSAIAALVALRGVRRRARTLGQALSRQYETIHARLEGSLSALRIVKSFGRERAEAAAIEREFAQLRHVELRHLRSVAQARAILHVGAAALLAAIVWIAVAQLGIAIALLLAFAALAARAVPLLDAVQGAWHGWSHAAPALAETRALVAEARNHAEVPPCGPSPRLKRSLRLDSVWFRHAGRDPALAGITLDIRAGTIAALTGPSGAGKSTLADIIGGLLSPDRGQVLIDGTPLVGGARNAWRERVAYVQQEPVLFTGTIRDNLLWAVPEADDDALRTALRRACAEFVFDLPGGLDCAPGEGGRALSGGERQRIALARALLREPDLLVLDEATSAVDSFSEARICEAVAALAGRCTVIVIGHRGRLVDLAERRLQIANGRLDDAAEPRGTAKFRRN